MLNLNSVMIGTKRTSELAAYYEKVLYFLIAPLPADHFRGFCLRPGPAEARR